MIKWFRSLFAWRLVHAAGVYGYEENHITSKRRAARIVVGGNSPLKQRWLDGAAWDEGPGLPPNQGSGGQRR